MIEVIIYRNTDTPFSLGFLASGDEVNITAFTRVTITLGDLILDSSIHSGVFDWSTYGSTGRMDVKAGHVPRLQKGRFKSTVTIYDATYPNGLVWDHMVVRVE